MVIEGRVIIRQTDQGVTGIRVKAVRKDYFKDVAIIGVNLIGQAVTDKFGRFQIDGLVLMRAVNWRVGFASGVRMEPEPISVFAEIEIGRAVTRVDGTFDGARWLITIDDFPSLVNSLEPKKRSISASKMRKVSSESMNIPIEKEPKPHVPLAELNELIVKSGGLFSNTEPTPTKNKNRSTRKSTSKIMISYRREDSDDMTGRIHDWLARRFGVQEVFRDINMPPGVDFPKYLDEKIAGCAVFLAVIGPAWMGPKNWKGKSRLDDPSDFVRMEVEWALARGIRLIPVLVKGASIPTGKQLPQSIQSLQHRNGHLVRSGQDFQTDMDRLIEYLEKEIPGLRRSE